MKELAITAANSITAVGHDGRMTSASVRAGVSRMFAYDEYLDGRDNPITAAPIRGIDDDEDDTATRLSSIAMMCFEDMLNEYFQNCAHLPTQLELLLGVASEERPGPRYEESCMGPLLEIMGKWANQPKLQTIPQGNASMHFAINQVGRLMESNPGAFCIIGGIDSLIRDSTLNWFEQDGRLKSESYGRHQGVIAGEAVSFLVVEDSDRAKQANRQILARISSLGLAEEPTPRASHSPSRNSGLTDACRAALVGTKDKDIRAVFGDLNGENSRAKEWSMTEMRCFKERHEQRKLWSPANCYGDIGAASGAVLANIATQGFVRGWLPSPVLIFCSDDHGPCGALVMENGGPQDGKP
ncbi:MAG: 3-oxoacyl-ACP synthase [Geobacteraceae bacterium GWC2_58_44]|nr:MAG: 3-oxoacyl-ACP synthase [Geobacteraceae bacterium GWC2_58_44]HBG06227.1 3-oxoacyl-ACP synthase [Geobacter sp.]